MGRLAPLLAIVLLAVFAAGVAVPTKAMADAGMMAMADCRDCPADGAGDRDGMACEQACTGPTAAALTGIVAVARSEVGIRQDRPIGARLGHGLRAPPDPFPPRTLS